MKLEFDVWHRLLNVYTKVQIDNSKHVEKCQENFKRGKSEGFDSCDRPSNLTQIGFKSLIFQPVWPWPFMDDLEI